MKKADKIILKRMFGVIVYAITVVMVLHRDGRDSRPFHDELDNLKKKTDDLSEDIDKWIKEEE